MAFVNRAFGSQRIHIAERLSEHLLVKEKHGVEGLVLGACRYIVPECQIGEE